MKRLASFGLGIGLLLALAPAAGALSEQQTEVTAQDLFDEVIYDLALNYGGPGGVRAEDLRAQFLPQVQALCGHEANVCGSKLAYPLIGRMLRELGDDHTNFFTPEEWEAAALASAGEASGRSFGLGIRLLKGQGVLVTEVIPGSPAEAGGLKPGDVLLRLEQMPLTGELGASKLAAAGRSGHAVDLTYSRVGHVQHADLTGEAFVTPPVSLTMLDDQTALLRLRHFDTAGIAQDVHNALRRAVQQGATRAVLDLRGNPGGLLNETILTAGALTQPATLRDVERSSTTLLSYDAGRFLEDGRQAQRVFKPQRFAGPLAVLIDQDSASGAEFLARDLLTRPNTAVLGQPTAGVADSATVMLDLADGSGLQVTVSRIQSAEGQALGARVQPQVKLTKDDAAFARTGEDPELAAALGALDTLQR